MARRKENPPEAANRPISRITHRRPKPPHVKREPKFRVEINQLNQFLGPSLDTRPCPSLYFKPIIRKPFLSKRLMLMEILSVL